MLLAGLHGNDIFTCVGGFDAEELGVGFVGEIGEALGFFDPGIPYDRCQAAGFFDDEFTLPERIMHDDGGIRDVHSVHFLIDDDGAELRAFVG